MPSVCAVVHEDVVPTEVFFWVAFRVNDADPEGVCEVWGGRDGIGRNVIQFSFLLRDIGNNGRWRSMFVGWWVQLRFPRIPAAFLRMGFATFGVVVAGVGVGVESESESVGRGGFSL